MNAAQAVSTQQTSEFSVEETGIQDTSETAIDSADTTVENDTTVTQSVDLDLLVPDDGDADGDIYNVTIDTTESLANGINVTGASVETDPSGSDRLVEVVGSPTITDDEMVTIQIREATANRSDGKVARETITVGLTLDSTQHDAGSFVAGETISHVVEDEAGNTTANLTFESAAAAENGGVAPVAGNSSPTNVDADTQLEDVNGNGELDIGDVQALYDSRQSDTVQNNVASFDFNNNDGIDIGDVQALYNEYRDA
jgi:PKD repeat protein